MEYVLSKHRAHLADTLALQNCLREIRFTLEMSKPIVLVQEADVTKGGGPLEASSQRHAPIHRS